MQNVKAQEAGSGKQEAGKEARSSFDGVEAGMEAGN
jgi:hypothetical protein